MANGTTDESPFDIVATPNVPRIFSDGLAQVQMGYPNTKLIFHDQVLPGKEGKKDQRVASAIMFMPTVTLVEVAHIILKLAKESEGLFVESSNEHQKKIFEMLKNVTLPSADVQD